MVRSSVNNIMTKISRLTIIIIIIIVFSCCLLQGILGNVTFGSVNLTGWEMYPIYSERLVDELLWSKDSTLRFSPKKEQSSR